MFDYFAMNPMEAVRDIIDKYNELIRENLL